jgi:hypothetical protein
MPNHGERCGRSLGWIASTLLLASCGGGGSSSGSGAQTVDSAPAAVTITTSLLPNGQAGAPYGTQLAASGGNAPYSWSISAGALPGEVSLQASSGKITGTPSTAGTYSVTAKVTDASSHSTTLALSIAVEPAPTSTSNLSSAPGWHKIPSTALCGGGSEGNPAYTDPDDFPHNLNASYASYGFGFTTQCYEFMEDSNSGAYDTARHRLILFGGGHEHYWGNDVFSLEMTLVNSGTLPMVHLDHSADPLTCPSSGPASTIVTESNGAVCQFDTAGTLHSVLGHPGCTYAAHCTPSQFTTPGSVHTYNTTVYIPGDDEMTVFGGATAPNGNGTGNVWLLALSSVLPSCAPNTTTNQQGCNPAWTSIGNPASSNVYDNPGNVGSVAAYDPNTQGVWIQNQYNLQWFNPANNTLTIESSTGIGYHSTAVLDPINKYLIMIGPQSTSVLEGILYIDVSCSNAPACTGSNFTVHQPATTGCSNLIGSSNASPQYMGAQWDPVSKRVVVYPNAGNVIWYLDPTTWTCTTETYGATQGTDYPQSTPGVTTGGENGTFGHFAYDPTFDVFVLCNDPHNDCWYLRPSR